MSMFPECRRAICIGLRLFVIVLGLTLPACSRYPRGKLIPRELTNVPATPASTRHVSPGTAIKVATVNAFGVAFECIPLEDDIAERFCELAALINASDYDIVALQEMWHNQSRRRFLDAVNDTYNFHDFESKAPDDAGGLTILFRKDTFSIREASYYYYGRNGKLWKIHEADYIGRKGVGILKLEHADGYLWIANTHLIACYPEEGNEELCNAGDPNGADRLHQTCSALEIVGRVAGSDPAIIMGDFNATPGAFQHQATLKGCAYDCPEGGGTCSDIEKQWHTCETECDNKWQVVPEANRPDGRLDYIWIRPGRTLSWQPSAPAQARERSDLEVSIPAKRKSFRSCEQYYTHRATVGDEKKKRTHLTDHPILAVELTTVHVR